MAKFNRKNNFAVILKLFNMIGHAFKSDEKLRIRSNHI